MYVKVAPLRSLSFLPLPSRPQKVEVEVVKAEEMVTVPEGYRVKRFTPFWKDLGKEWN